MMNKVWTRRWRAAIVFVTRLVGLADMLALFGFSINYNRLVEDQIIGQSNYGLPFLDS